MEDLKKEETKRLYFKLTPAWIPELPQFAITRNVSYLHSLWLGTGALALTFPVTLWWGLLHPVGALIWRFVVVHGRLIWSGISGNLTAWTPTPVSEEEAKRLIDGQ